MAQTRTETLTVTDESGTAFVVDKATAAGLDAAGLYRLPNGDEMRPAPAADVAPVFGDDPPADTPDDGTGDVGTPDGLEPPAVPPPSDTPPAAEAPRRGRPPANRATPTA